jgi:RPA family protein
MSRTTKLVFKFLRELDSRDVQDTFESLGTLLEHLETKNDPEPVDVQVVDTAYQALEKLKTLEGLLKRYIGESNSGLKGNKLAKLYEQTEIPTMFD